MSTFPTVIDSFTTHVNGDVIQPAYDNAQQVALVALETKVGIDGSAVSSTHSYKLSGVTGSDKAVSLAGSEALTNKSINGVTPSTTAGATNFLKGDGSYGVPTISDASYAAKGVVEFLTNAATSGITIASGVANVNMGTSANQVVQLNGSAQLPAVSGALLTNIPYPTSGLFKNGVTTYDPSTASGTQNIAHGLGVIPKKVKITASYTSINGSSDCDSFTVYNGTTQSSIYRAGTANNRYQGQAFLLSIDASGNNSTGTITFDATNIIITWTKTGTLTSVSFELLWETEA